MPKEFEGENFFSQDEVNKFNKEERLKREVAEKINEDSATEKETLLSQIDTMKKTAQLTDEQKAQHEKEMEEIRQKGLTDAQKQDETIIILKQEVKQKEIDSKKTNDEWQSLHHSMLVKNEIMNNLGDTDDHTAARQAEPVVALLSSKITVEQTDDGYIPVVKNFPVANEEGKIEKKDVSISDAIIGLFKTEQYRYLFDEKGKSGTGGDGGDGGGDDSDISDPDNPPMDGKRYPAWHNKHIKAQ